MTLTPFAVAQDIATRLGRTFTSAQTAQATAFCEDASELIRDHCRQSINYQTGVTMDIEAPDGPWLTLPQRPVVNIQSVTVNGNAVSDYSKIGDRLYRVYGWRWPSVDTIPPLAIYGLKSTVHVVYDAGYNPVPSEVVTVCRRMVMRAMFNPAGLTRSQIDDFVSEYGEAGTGVILTDADKKSLRRFRRAAFSFEVGTGTAL